MSANGFDVQLRARFIPAFIQPDIVASDGVIYDRSRAVGADAMLTSYLDWLSRRDDPLRDDSSQGISSRDASDRRADATAELP